MPANARNRAGEADITTNDVAVGDLDPLFRAVRDRLRAIAGDGLGPGCAPAVPETAQQVRANVLECVTALDQLYLTLLHEVARQRRHEPESTTH